MDKTKIEWADATWNPVTGCKHGCEYCYARRIAGRFSGYDGYGCEKDHDRVEEQREYYLTEPAYIKRGKGGKLTNSPYPFGFEPTFHKYRLERPRIWKEPRNIFVCSMADLFGAWVPTKWIVDVLDACRAAPQHRYLFLTKNPARYAELDKLALLPREENFWYGSTLDSMEAKRFQGHIRLNTFVSIEPLTERMDVGLGSFGGDRWVIIGAETGNRKDKVTPEKEWVDTICAAADLTHAAVFMKDSLRPIMGEENMRRELPWEKRT